MENNKHILFITSGFPVDEADTRCIPALQLFMEELQERKAVNITVISLHYPYEAKAYQWKGIPVYAMGEQNRMKFLRFGQSKRVLKTATKIHAHTPFTHIHSFWLTDAAQIANRLAETWQLPHTCTLMGQDVLKANPYVKRIAPLPQLISLSDFQRQAFKEAFGKSTHYQIPWGIKKEESKKDSKRTIDILGVGNITPLKNFDRFVTIVKGLQSEFPDIRAEIIGEGDKSKLQKRIAEVGLTDHIRLYDFMNREDVMAKMQQSKCLLHCSTYESFGMVLIEGLALGLHVISTAVGIAGEIPAIHTYQSNAEAVKVIRNCLTESEQPPHSYPFPISQTVDSYLKDVF